MIYIVPEWSEIRAKGEALAREHPDDQFMKTVLDGAFLVGESENPIRGNLCAAALRELTGHVLHVMAPDQLVTACSWFVLVPDTKGPTRKQRVTYIVQGALPADFVEKVLKLDLGKVARPLLRTIESLNRSTHVREETILDDDEDIRVLVDDTLDGLLNIYDAARICREEVHNALRMEVFDAVLDTLLSETLQELDELSTHTTVDGHEIGDYTINFADNEFIELAVDGTVYVELQYGSNSDVRKDMGAVLPDSYPYRATMKSRMLEPQHIIRDSVVVSVDNGAFYE
ncbi:hypothetical protein GHK58_34000 [Sinorhizobium meliloti]|uniref:pPIWI-associating nuclease domain-containing protein n=1 Tax=Rhizobium meliloti TaxID=382 RepID=UPI001295E1E3|nr:hypothetical protein [Sinorhizobium meliloti]MQX40360.1 hypothetical protein [Sinorhizobium meliloti]MQX45010.1 hypothetical protein [Sinorhizobium meliloti]